MQQPQVAKLSTEAPASSQAQNSDLNTTTAASTSFLDHSVVHHNEARPMRERLIGPSPYDSNTISDFLAKPVRVANGNLSFTDTVNTVKFTSSIAALLNANSVWKLKIAGYNLIRATCNIKVVVNATPFQQGRVLLNFIPMYSSLTAGEQAALNVGFGQITTSPNVELDIQETSCEMSIPYISPYTYYDRREGQVDWGTFWFRVLYPLQAGSAGTGVCDYSIFVHWTDVELAAPRFGPEMAKPAPRRTVKKVLHRESDNASSSGWISSAASKISDLSSTIAGFGVPGAAIISSAASAASTIANLFGWSKPINTTVPHQVISNPLRGINVYDNANNAESFGFGISPVLEPSYAMFGAQVDEMSWEYLKSIPAYLATFKFKNSDVIDAQIYELQLLPKNLLQTFTKTVGANTCTYGVGSPAFWLANLFDKYRGGIDVTFKFVKTPFATGRLVITYVPDSSLGVTFDQSVYVLREIIDLQSTSEITLTLPYIKGQNYLPTETSMGVLRVHVLNEYKAPDAAPTEAGVLVYVSGAKDFELATLSGVQTRVFTPEMDMTNAPTSVNKGIGDSVQQDIDYKENLLSINDPFVSLKQLFACSRRVFSIDTSIFTSANYVCSPFANGLSRYTTAGINFQESSAFTMDFIQMLSHGYAFFRGGVRITRSSTGPASGIYGAIVSSSASIAGGLGTYGIAIGNTASDWTKQYLLNELEIIPDRGIDANVPFWNSTPIAPVRYITNVSAVYPGTEIYPPLRLYVGEAAGISGRIYRSGMDDYAVGYFRGFMPLVVSLS